MYGVLSRGIQTKREVVEKDCQARKLNEEDAMDCSRWRMLIKDVWWSGWMWVGECFFWYRPTSVVPDKGPLNGCVLCFGGCRSASITASDAHVSVATVTAARRVHAPAAQLPRNLGGRLESWRWKLDVRDVPQSWWCGQWSAQSHRSARWAKTTVGGCTRGCLVATGSCDTGPPLCPSLCQRWWHAHFLHFFCYIINPVIIVISHYVCFQCFDAVGWAAGRASGL